MHKIDKSKYEEFHDGEKEFCRESGPLVTKKIDAPSAIAKAIAMSLATVATMAAVIMTPTFKFMPKVVDVVANTAIIETKIENIPENSELIYTLVAEDKPNTIIEQGEILDIENNLEFNKLDFDRKYIVSFFLKQDDKTELINKVEFKTEIKQDGNKSDVGELNNPIIPETPIIPEDPIVPNEPIVPEVPVVPEEPPTTPETPETSTTDIKVQGVTVNSAQPDINDDAITGYRVEETHTFTDVPSNEYEIQITQNGAVTNYENTYDSATQTVTITYLGNAINAGTTSSSEVSLTYKDGTNVVSTNSITAPKINTFTLDVLDNQDGSYTYTVESSGIEPSIGTIEVIVTLYNDLDDKSTSPKTEMFTKTTSNFTEEFTYQVEAPGETLTAGAIIELIWSLDETHSAQLMDTTIDYQISDLSEITFTDISEGGSGGYVYTVNAKFANLASATPQSMAFYRYSYNWEFNENDPEELVTTLDASQIIKEANGNITANYTLSDAESVYRESQGHSWRVVLTYLDATNTSRTVEITNAIEPLDVQYNHLNSVMWQENGITYVDYEHVFSFNETYTPKGATLLNVTSYNWEVLSSELEFVGNHGYVRGRMSSTNQYELSSNIYLDWAATPTEDYIYSGCGGAGYLESSRTKQEFVLNSTNDGYDTISEEFTFTDGASLIDDYYEEYILVTLADGTQIKVTETEPDTSGRVAVNWNDNNNIVVSVNQSDVLIGESTIVDFVVQYTRGETEMLGLINHYTYRCYSNYE